MCNRGKSDLDHGGRLVKPDAEDPELLLWLHPDTGALEPHPILDQVRSQRVLETLAAYNLQRGALCAERIRMMTFVHNWLARLGEGLAASKACQKEWRYIIEPRTPWKFVVRHVLTKAGQAQLAEIDRQAFLRPASKAYGAPA
jgi:hypothetical protein